VKNKAFIPRSQFKTLSVQNEIESPISDIFTNDTSLGITSDLRQHYKCSVGDSTAFLLQENRNVILKSFKPSLLLLLPQSHQSQSRLSDVIEESLQFFMNSGGRITRLVVACDPSVRKSLEIMGFELAERVPDEIYVLFNRLSQSRSLINPNLDSAFLSNVAMMTCNIPNFVRRCKERLAEGTEKARVNNILGRLSHETGEFDAAIGYYTSALMDSSGAKSASIFRNLGSAYHAKDNTQMAFASYQQAIQLDPEGL
jgi:tetratricopeptide (TPR) repeat protein